MPSAKVILPKEYSNSYLALDVLENGNFKENEKVEYEKIIEEFINLEDSYSYKINKTTGEVTHINYDSSGKIIGEYTTNFHDSLKNLLRVIKMLHMM
ncbi:hypothetical protein ACQPU1_04105 [Clostridium paraputrificum]